MGVFHRTERERLLEAKNRPRKVELRTPARRGKPARREEPQPGAFRQRLLKAIQLTGMALVLLPIAAGGMVLGGLAAWLENAPGIEEFDRYNPPETTTILDKNGNSLAALYEQRRYVVPIKALPPQLPQAFVSIEDERFRRHMGVDPMGLARAMSVNLMRGKMSQGASTITQQTARNLIPEIGTEKTSRRKLMEMLVALQMEHRYSKDQILEVYLNQIYLGSGAYGVEAAAQTYFGKKAAELNVAECATLAGLPQLPERYSPLNNPALAQKRRDQVLAAMWKQGAISDAEFDRAVTTEVSTSSSRPSRSNAAYFVDAIRREVADHAQLGGDKLQTAGWLIRATVDPKMQEIAEAVIRDGLDNEETEWLAGRQERYAEALAAEDYARMPAAGQVRMGEVAAIFEKSVVVKFPGGWKADLEIPSATASYFKRDENIRVGEGVDLEVTEVDTRRGLFKGNLLPRWRLQGAIVCIDIKTGDVRALAGGRDYNDRQNNGYFNRAVLAHRQAGSTFKPLFFAYGYENGLTPETVIYDGPITFGDGYSPKNYEKKFFGATPLEKALEKSRNIPTIKLVQQVGLRGALDYVARFQRIGTQKWDLPLEWPVVLGTTSVTPLELAATYQTIANGGVACGPRIIEGIWNEEEREAVGLPQPEQMRLIAAQANAWIIQGMAGVMTHGTGEKLRVLLPDSLRNRVVGKSGTTNDNRDAWFTGFTPHEVIVVWMGFDQNIPLAPSRTGSRAAGPIWADFAARTWELKTPAEQNAPIPMPPGFVMAAIDPGTGFILREDQLALYDPPTFRAFRTEDYERLRPRAIEYSQVMVLE